MRAVVQRVREAAVHVDGACVGAIGPGLLVLVGVAPGDGEAQLRWMANKLVHSRLFADADGKMNASLLEIGGAALLVSQFTLFGDVQKGRRPSFVGAAAPAVAAPCYAALCDAVASLGVPVARGIFGADMQVSLVNDGPVTLFLETP